MPLSMFLLVACTLAKLKDSDLLVTQDLVDRINRDPHSSFKATLYPQFSRMTVGEAKRFLGPVRKPPTRKSHGSPRPIGANENSFVNLDMRVLTGYYKIDGTPKNWNWNLKTSTVSGTVCPLLQKEWNPCLCLTNI